MSAQEAKEYGNIDDIIVTTPEPERDGPTTSQ